MIHTVLHIYYMHITLCIQHTYWKTYPCTVNAIYLIYTLHTFCNSLSMEFRNKTSFPRDWMFWMIITQQKSVAPLLGAMFWWISHAVFFLGVFFSLLGERKVIPLGDIGSNSFRRANMIRRGTLNELTSALISPWSINSYDIIFTNYMKPTHGGTTRTLSILGKLFRFCIS